MVDKSKKTPTESVKLDAIWEGFKSEYLPFVEWEKHPDDNFSFCEVKFLENNPVKYENKWAREQFKIRVEQNETEKVLSAGKRLFEKLKNFCVNENKLPTALGIIQISRIGSGFDINYKIQYSLKQTSIN